MSKSQVNLWSDDPQEQESIEDALYDVRMAQKAMDAATTHYVAAVAALNDTLRE